MRGIERYEAKVSLLRDGVWIAFIVSAFLGWIHFAEALIFGGLSWFTLALARKVPRWLSGLRPYFAGRWRLVNRLLLVYVVTLTFTAEYIRANRMDGAEAVLLFIFVSAAILTPSIAYLKKV